MGSTCGIRASGSEDCVKKKVLEDATSYGPWKANLTSILVAEDQWEIVCGTEIESVRIANANYVDNAPLNKPAVDAR